MRACSVFLFLLPKAAGCVACMRLRRKPPKYRNKGKPVLRRIGGEKIGRAVVTRPIGKCVYEGKIISWERGVP